MKKQKEETPKQEQIEELEITTTDAEIIDPTDKPKPKKRF